MDDLPNEVAYDLLANERRRRVCELLAATDRDQLSLGELTDDVVRLGTPDGPTRAARQRRRIAIDLHHVQLPKLDDAGVVEYDPRGKTVYDLDHPLVEAVAPADENDAFAELKEHE